VLTHVTAVADSERAATIRADRSTVFAGSCDDGSGCDACIARRNGDDAPDATFSTNGIDIAPISTDGHDKAAALASHSDGKVLAATGSLIYERIALGIRFPTEAKRPTRISIRTCLVTQCGMSLAP